MLWQWKAAWIDLNRRAYLVRVIILCQNENMIASLNHSIEVWKDVHHPCGRLDTKRDRIWKAFRQTSERGSNTIWPFLHVELVAFKTKQGGKGRWLPPRTEDEPSDHIMGQENINLLPTYDPYQWFIVDISKLCENVARQLEPRSKSPR